MKGRKRSFSSLMDAVVIYDREIVLKRFEEKANYYLLTIPDENLGKDIINDVFDGVREPGEIWRKFEGLPGHIQSAIKSTFVEIDIELPEMFRKCQTPYDVRSVMLDMGFSSKDEFEDKDFIITFKKYGFSLSQRIPAHVFSTETLAKLAYIVLITYDKFTKLTRSFII